MPPAYEITILHPEHLADARGLPDGKNRASLYLRYFR